MPLVGFEPTIAAGEWPYTYALDRAITGTGIIIAYKQLILKIYLATDNTTTAGINYTELHDCKWDPITLTKKAFNFL
jgi:hypothetical protein